MKNSFPLFILLCLMVFYGCKKEPGDDKTGILCTGNGNNEWYPMAVGNVWQFTPYHLDSIKANTGSQYMFSAIQGVDTARVASNGDLYIRYHDDFPYSFQEFLFIPANPVVGQTWTTILSPEVTNIMEVISVNSSVITSDCRYDDCLRLKLTQATSYNGNPDTSVIESYFKKGVGPLYYTSKGTFLRELSRVVLH